MKRRLFLLGPIALLTLGSSACTIHSYGPGSTPQPHRSAALVPAAATPASPAQAQTPSRSPQAEAKAKNSRSAKPVLLGSRSVNLRAEKDTLAVGHPGRFRALQLHVSGSPISLYRMRVTFADGSQFEPRTRHHFNRNSRTRRIDLPDHRRRVLKVELWYRSKAPHNGKARVNLLGLR